MSKFTLGDLKKELNKTNPMYDDFELRELGIVAKNYKTGEKLECFGSGGYNSETRKRTSVNPLFVKQHLVNKESCHSIDDLINVLEDIDGEIGDFTIVIEDEYGNSIKKLSHNGICSNNKIEIFNIQDEYINSD